MIVLHGCVEPRRFLLWGETPAATVRPARRGKRRPAATAARPLPFGVRGEALAQAVADLVPSDVLGFAQERTVWLPTANEQPIASSPLIAEPPASTTSPTLAPWQVTVLPLAYAQAVDLLCACRGKDTLTPGVIVGATLGYWADALQWAGALTAREQFLPGIEKILSGWRQLSSGADDRDRHLK